MNENPQLETILRQRAFEPASPYLAERIIAASRRLPQRVSLNLREWLYELFSEFMMPKPAYALAFIIMLGIGIGISQAEMTTQEDIQTALTEDGEWL